MLISLFLVVFSFLSLRVLPKIVNTALKAKAKATGPEAKAIKFGLEAPRGQGLASRTTSLNISLQMPITELWLDFIKSHHIKMAFAVKQKFTTKFIALYE